MALCIMVHTFPNRLGQAFAVNPVSADNDGPGDIIQPETLTQSTVRAVIEYIRQNGLKAGAKLPGEASFTQQLGVSRTVVREAFKSLAAMHVIEMSAGRRAQVGAFDDSVITLILTHALRTEQINVHQIWDARRAIEIRTVELAAMHCSAEEGRHITELARQMRKHHNDLPAMTEYDIAFHIAIAEATRNPLLPVLVTALTGAMRETNPIVWRSRKTTEAQMEVVALHEEIAVAIANRNPTTAVEALQKHFDVAASELVKAGFN